MEKHLKWNGMEGRKNGKIHRTPRNGPKHQRNGMTGQWKGI